MDDMEFNKIMDGYVFRAFKYLDATIEEVDRFRNALRYAKDDMTLDMAKKEYDDYYHGKFKFKEKK